jgi:hypothetical protein
LFGSAADVLSSEPEQVAARTRAEGPGPIPTVSPREQTRPPIQAAADHSSGDLTSLFEAESPASQEPIAPEKAAPPDGDTSDWMSSEPARDRVRVPVPVRRPAAAVDDEEEEEEEEQPNPTPGSASNSDVLFTEENDAVGPLIDHTAHVPRVRAISSSSVDGPWTRPLNGAAGVPHSLLTPIIDDFPAFSPAGGMDAWPALFPAPV